MPKPLMSARGVRQRSRVRIMVHWLAMPRFAVPDAVAHAQIGICSRPDGIPFGMTWPVLTCSQASSTDAGERLPGSILYSNDTPANLPTSDVSTHKTHAHDLLMHSCIR